MRYKTKDKPIKINKSRDIKVLNATSHKVGVKTREKEFNTADFTDGQKQSS